MAGVCGVEPWRFTAWELRTMCKGARPEAFAKKSTMGPQKWTESIPIRAANIGDLKRVVKNA